MIDTKIYQQTFQYARENGELEVFRESNKCNQECATAIDKAVAESRHDRHFYNLPAALSEVSKEFGLDRVAWVVAATIQYHDYDGRYSHANKDWAQSFPIPKDRESRVLLNTHPAVLDGFADKVRWARLDAASPIAAVEMSTEQNYNQIDGVRNNMAVSSEEKPSVLGKIQEARLTPTPNKEPRTPEKEVRGDAR